MSHITPASGGHLTPEPYDGPRFDGGGHWTPAEQRAAWNRVHPKWKSTVRRAGKVSFPPFAAERVYMVPFLKDEESGEVLLPKRLSHWVPTVEAMLEGITSSKRLYLMIDQAEVKPGDTHRRAGAHIDGIWNPKRGGSCTADFEAKERFEGELVVLASDVAACVAYTGSYDPCALKPGGDCSTLNLSKLTRVPMEAGHAYVGTAATIHESVPVKRACQRTLVRINVPRL